MVFFLIAAGYSCEESFAMRSRIFEGKTPDFLSSAISFLLIGAGASLA